MVLNKNIFYNFAFDKVFFEFLVLSKLVLVKNKSVKYQILFLLSLNFLLPWESFGQVSPADSYLTRVDKRNDVPGLFESDELLTLNLKFDLSTFKRKRSDEDYLEALLYYNNSFGDSVGAEIRVRARGEFRRTYCALPPMLLNFKSEDSSFFESTEVDKVKMVTRCKADDPNLVFKEYLAYRMYNMLTENSLRVRLLQINFFNTARQNEQTSEFAFFIEPVENLTKRLGAMEVRTAIDQKEIIPDMLDRFAIFNYMIGNTDWSVLIQHNVLLLLPNYPARRDRAIIVPYDFDFSGLVNANYSAPYPSLKIKSVRERLYLGICRTEEEYVAALKEFLSLKDDFYKLINEFPYLEEKSRREMISYLDGFFAGIDSRNTLAKMLMLQCLGY